MGIYKSIKDFGKRSVLTGGLIGIIGFGGCMSQKDMEIKTALADFNGDVKPLATKDILSNQ